jgi:hypothetical protein
MARFLSFNGDTGLANQEREALAVLPEERQGEGWGSLADLLSAQGGQASRTAGQLGRLAAP